MAIIKGKAYYAKIVGEPVEGYTPGPENREWTIDLSLTPEAKEVLIRDGFEDKIKNKGDERGDFITFKRKAVKNDGSPAQPIKIVDADKNAWDGKLIGNGSVVNIKYAINEWTFGKKSGVKPSILAVQVWEHIPYVGKGEDFEGRSGDDQQEQEAW